MGRLVVLVMNKIKFDHEGIYPVLLLGFACMIYSATNLIGGSGFLAVYLTGIAVGNKDFVQKKSLIRFFDGLACIPSSSCLLLWGYWFFLHTFYRLSVSELFYL